MTLQKQSVFVRMDGGLSDGDTDTISVEPSKALETRNFSHRKDGSVITSSAVEIVGDQISWPASTVVLGSDCLILNDDAVISTQDGDTLRSVSGGYGQLAISTNNDVFPGYRAVIQPSCAIIGDVICHVGWDVSAGLVRVSTLVSSSQSVSAQLPANTYNPVVVAQGSSSASVPNHFIVGAKVDNGPSTPHSFYFAKVSLDGVLSNGTAYALGGGSVDHRNGWSVVAGGIAGTAFATYNNADNATASWAIVTPGTGSPVASGNILSTQAGTVIGGFRDTINNRHITVINPLDNVGQPRLVRQNLTTGALVDSVVMTAPGTEHATVAYRASYNIAGLCIDYTNERIIVLRSSMERDGTFAGGNGGTNPVDVNLGDPRSTPRDMPAGADALYVASKTLRIGTVAQAYSISGLVFASQSFIPGAGVVGNGVVSNGTVIFPFEWGFPCASDNARPGSGGVTFEGKPIPWASELSTGGFTLPFTDSTSPERRRPGWWRPTITATGLYPDAEDSTRVSLGASLFDQEQQAHWAYISQNATCAFQEGRLGLMMSLDYLSGWTPKLLATFLANTLSTRSNYAPVRKLGVIAADYSDAVLISSNNDCVAANASQLYGLAIPPCNLHLRSDGTIIGAFVEAADTAYYGRSVSTVTATEFGVSTSISSGSSSGLVSSGGLISVLNSSGITPGVVPRPSHLFSFGDYPNASPDFIEETIVDPVYGDAAMPLIQRSSELSEPSSFVEFGFLFVRYRVRRGTQVITSQLSPPLMVRTEDYTDGSWQRNPGTVEFLGHHTPTTGTAGTYYWNVFGPTVRGTRTSDGVDFGRFRRAFFVPAIPWIDDADIELDVYLDDYGTSLGTTTAGVFSIVLPITSGWTIPTFELSRTPSGQPRYVGTVRPSRLYSDFNGVCGGWLGFYFGTKDTEAPLSYELGNFAPTANLGASEPIAAEALEATPTVPPPARSMSRYQDRVLLVSADDPRQVWISKPTLSGQIPQFSDELVVTVPGDGDGVVAAAALEERLIILRQNSILQTAGSLPDSTGAGGTLGELSPLTTEVGCISSGSVVETPLGLAFESQKGFCVISPNGGVDMISADVNDLCGLGSTQNCSSACVNTVESEVLFSMSSNTSVASYVLVWNYKFNRWSKLETTLPITSLSSRAGTVWGVAANLTSGVTNGTGRVVRFSEPTTASGSLLTTSLVSTPWIKPGSAVGYSRVNKAHVLGSVGTGTYATSTITVTIYVDYSTTADSTRTFNVADVVDSSGVFHVIVCPAKQKGQAFRFAVEVNRLHDDDSIPNTANITLNGVQLDLGVKTGSFKNVGTAGRG